MCGHRPASTCGNPEKNNVHGKHIISYIDVNGHVIMMISVFFAVLENRKNVSETFYFKDKIV